MPRPPRHQRTMPRACHLPSPVCIGLVVAFGGLSTSVAAQGPRPGSMSRMSTTSVVGIVGDSLHGGPLAGAIILLDGQSREAVTDSIGRFRIDSVSAGRYRVGIFHPVLDSLGTS